MNHFFPKQASGAYVKISITLLDKASITICLILQFSKWLWFVNNIVASLNKHNILIGCFGLYPSFVAGILNSVEEIHFYVVRDEQLIYADY